MSVETVAEILPIVLVAVLHAVLIAAHVWGTRGKANIEKLIARLRQ